MGGDIERSQFDEIVERLAAAQVKFVVIGGQAENLLGSARVTFDTDLCYARDKQNLERLAEAAAELRPALRGAPAGLPFKLDARTLEMGNNFTLTTTRAIWICWDMWNRLAGMRRWRGMRRRWILGGSR